MALTKRRSKPRTSKYPPQTSEVKEKIVPIKLNRGPLKIPRFIIERNQRRLQKKFVKVKSNWEKRRRLKQTVAAEKVQRKFMTYFNESMNAQKTATNALTTFYNFTRANWHVLVDLCLFLTTYVVGKKPNDIAPQLHHNYELCYEILVLNEHYDLRSKIFMFNLLPDRAYACLFRKVRGTIVFLDLINQVTSIRWLAAEENEEAVRLWSEDRRNDDPYPVKTPKAFRKQIQPYKADSRGRCATEQAAREKASSDLINIAKLDISTFNADQTSSWKALLASSIKFTDAFNGQHKPSFTCFLKRIHKDITKPVEPSSFIEDEAAEG